MPGGAGDKGDKERCSASKDSTSSQEAALERDKQPSLAFHFILLELFNLRTKIHESVSLVDSGHRKGVPSARVPGKGKGPVVHFLTS